MAQHDMNIANQGFPAFRSDLNSALSAIISNSSGATEPSTTVAYQFWADTTNDLLKQRNAANDGWVSILTLSTGAPVGITADKIIEGNSYIEVIDSGTGYAAVVIDGVETARFDANNRVGFGTSTPASRVDVNGSITFRDGADTRTGKINFSTGALVLATNTGGEPVSIAPNNVSTFQAHPGGEIRANAGFGTVSAGYFARAWVVFNGTGTVAINDSKGVSSITDNGTGQYMVNLSITMPDTNYVVTGAHSSISSGGSSFAVNRNAGKFSTTYQEVLCSVAGGFSDPIYVSVVFHR